MRTLVDLAILSEPTGTTTWIQIMKAGQWDHPTLGKIKITPADLARFKENFDNKVRGTDIAVDVDHNPGGGAVGWFKELRVDGDKLMALVSWTEEGANLVQSGKYRYFSPEFMFQWTDPESKKTYQDVLFGGGITNRPFLKNMDPIEFSESGAGAEMPMMGSVWFAEGDNRPDTGDDDPSDDDDYAPSMCFDDDTPYDPDGDGDDDSTTDPSKNPDWISDVKMGATAWPTNKAQQAEIKAKGIDKATADRNFTAFQKAHPMPKKAVKMAEGADSEEAKAKAAQEARSKKYGIAIKQGGNVNKPSKYAEISDDEFADPVNYAYPITPEYVMAAYKYFAMPKNREQYSPEEQKIVAKRIVAKLPEANKDEARKTFKLDDGTGKTTPDDGDTNPRPNDDANAGKFSDPTRGGAKKMPDETITMSEHQKALDRIKSLEEQNRRISMNEKVVALIAAGKIVPAQKSETVELLVEMSEEQATKYLGIIEKGPVVVKFGDEKGFGGDPGAPKSPDKMLVELTEKKIKEGKSARNAAIEAHDEITAQGFKLDRGYVV